MPVVGTKSIQRQPRLSPGCDQKLRYDSQCRGHGAALPNCPNCGNLLYIPHHCTTLHPEPEERQQELI